MSEPAADRPQADARSQANRGSYRSGFAFGTLSFLSVAVIGMLSTIVTARLYRVTIIGEFALISVPVGALWVLSTVKEQQALIKEITGLPARHPRVTQLFSVVFTFSMALTIFMALVDATVCWFVMRGPLHVDRLVAPTFVSLAGYTFVTNVGWNIDSIFAAFVAGRQIFFVRLHEILSFIVLAVVIGLMWHSVWGLVIATIAASATSLVHRTILARKFVSTRLRRSEYRAGFQLLPALLRFGLKATPGQICQGISQQGGIWALGMVAPIAVVGAYSRAQNVPQRLQQASMRITEVLYPTLVGRHTKGERHGFDRALIDSIRYEVILMLLVACTIGGGARLVLELFGHGFGRAAPALVLLALYPAVASITATQTQALWAVDRPALTSVIAGARLLITVVALIVLTPWLGVTGPAISLLLGYLLVAILSGLALRSSLARPLRATWAVRERLALVLCYAAGYGATTFVESRFSTLAGLVPCLAAGTAAYAAVFLILGVNERDRRRARELVRLLSRRRARTSAALED